MSSQHKKPELHFWQIWNMCFGFMGIQFGFALQNSNISRIFQTLGADMSAIPILFVAAPITGLIVQPIIGHFSDNTWNRLGRRRPYFFWGAILTTISLVFMPSSPTLWAAAIMLWIMDASINVTMEPFRAFVGDMLPRKQRTFGFVMQTMFIGVGAVTASMLPWIFTNIFDVANTAPEGVIPDSVRYSFYIGAAAVALAVGWTIIRTKEYSPEQLAKFEQASDYQPTLDGPKQGGRVFSASKSSLWIAAGLLFSFTIYFSGWQYQLYILSGCLLAYGVLQLIAAMLESKGSSNSFYQACRSVILMPKTMRQLALVQFFSWFPLFAMWVYTTPSVAKFHFGSSDVLSAAYNEGANWVSVLFGAYNGVSILAALVIPMLARKLGLKGTHAFNLVLGGLGLISMTLIKDPALLLISMVGVGFAWASILSVPYAILSNSIPANNMGIYMGVFNFFIVIPQLVAASLLGLALEYVFGGETIYILALAGVFWLVAACSIFLVTYHAEFA